MEIGCADPVEGDTVSFLIPPNLAGSAEVQQLRLSFAATDIAEGAGFSFFFCVFS